MLAADSSLIFSDNKPITVSPRPSRRKVSVHEGARRRRRDLSSCSRADGGRRPRHSEGRSLRELRVRAASDQAAHTTPVGAARRALVAGAGPAGALAALYLARQGFAVTVCDRRDSAADAFSSSPTLGYNMGLNERAIKARDGPCVPDVQPRSRPFYDSSERRRRSPGRNHGRYSPNRGPCSPPVTAGSSETILAPAIPLARRPAPHGSRDITRNHLLLC